MAARRPGEQREQNEMIQSNDKNVRNDGGNPPIPSNTPPPSSPSPSSPSPPCPPSSPPPLEFVNIDPNLRLPRPPPPSDPALIRRAEEMVHWAVSSKHENSPFAANATNANDDDDGENNDAERRTSAVVEASKQHSLLAALLQRKSSDASLLLAVLHALVAANHGRELDRLVSNSKLHAQLIHLIMRLDPFVPPNSSSPGDGEGTAGGAVVGMDRLRDLDRARRERKKREGDPKQSTIRIAESSIRHKENAAYLRPASPYLRYEIADAHLYLLTTLVSNNSILGVSAVRSMWGMLTEFGGRWTEWANEEMEGAREERRRRRRQMMPARESPDETGRRSGGGDGDDEEGPPPSKRRKIDVGLSSPPSKTGNSQAAVDNGGQSQLQQHPEDKRPVPGMGGLSVEFVRDAFQFCGTDSAEEEIYSDRLASGRVRRLLLALLNIVRLCPRSKLDVQREITSNFPHHKTAPQASYVWYMHICHQMVHLVPTFEGPVLCLFVDRALEMDVEIKIGEGGSVLLDNAAAVKGEDNGAGDEGVGDGLKCDGSHDQSPSMVKKRTYQQISQTGGTAKSIAAGNNIDDTDDESDRILEMSERLDALMSLFFRHIARETSFDPTSLPSAMRAVVNARRLHRHLGDVFDQKVRTTDRSKFVQFAFFVLFGRESDALDCVVRLMAAREQSESATKDDDDTATPSINVMDPLYRAFSAKLIDRFYDPAQVSGDVPRQTAVCYLASFASRAKYVCPETVCECLAALIRWAEAYIEAQSGNDGASIGGGGGIRCRSTSSSGGNARRHPCEAHALFYTACQAAFYIMCFRGAEAISYYRSALRHKDDPESPYADPESVNIGPERWRNLCGHSLRPLRYCLESVRTEFLYLAEDLDLFLLSKGGHDGKSLGETERRDEANDYLRRLRSASSPQGGKKQTNCQNDAKSASASAAAPKKRKARSRRIRTIISTAATQEKKRLDGGVGGLGRGSNPLDSFFPFDPYLLQKSYVGVHPYYRNWEDCILTVEEEKSGEEEEGVISNDGEYLDVSDPEEDEEGIAHAGDGEEDEEESGDDKHHDEEEDEDGEDNDDDRSQCSKDPAKSVGQTSSPTTAAATGFVTLHEDSHFEMELRRSRAMSTGSQCSW